MDKNAIVQTIYNEIIGGGYDGLEKIVLDNPSDMRLLYYSCILYEQEKESGSKDNQQKHRIFWKEEVEGKDSFLNLLEEVKKTKLKGYPTSIVIEASTYCNARCTNCTHESLIKSGKRPQKLADLRDVYYRIRKCKLITLLFNVEVDDIGPTGLGEPLLHPELVQILNYMRIFFPDARIGLNTNISLLKGELARQIARVIDYIYLSLSYFDKDVYEKQVGLDYEKAINNICDYLRICREEESRGNVIIHIFDNNLNSKEDIEQFKNKFQPLLRENDVLEIRKYLELVKNDIRARGQRTKKIRPCYQLWQVMIVDVEGNIWPCCMGVWKEYDRYLALGNINEPIIMIAEKLKNLRKMQFNGDFGTCLQCDTLYRNRKFKLPYLFYDKENSTYGGVQYTTKINFLSWILQKVEERISI